ncbi:acyltransferase [Bradyrhizobium jicamae]|uniref:Acyltransferase n=1 Tax=Bradyrhizobium jicamae TaxID=280332 RepID=A0ABS5FGR5_9BRAD|nr:acyltransferase family protein [Bradyrhizobium jicamae]MBR0795975.1 acyltransferase [Bradyrhizobium jicamae]
MEFRNDINGLRAVAVLLVLLFHFHEPGFGGGFIGVDVFFVVSGFLMTGIILSGLEKHSFSVLGFYRARLVRLYPALLAVVAATLLFGLIFVEPGALESIARDGISALLFVSNIVFWQQHGYFGASPEAMWMLHTWSLSVEWQFYLVFPVVLALAFPWLTGATSRFALLLIGFVLSLTLSVVLGTCFPNNDRIVSAEFYLLPPRAWEMLAGGLVAMWPWRAPFWAARAAGLLEFVGIALVLSSLFFSENTAWPSYVALLPVGGTMLVLAARAPRTALDFAPLQRIGTWSYSIYLWHWPMVAAIAYFSLSGPLVAPSAFVLSMLAGWASFTFVEQPCRTLLRGKPSAPHGTSSRNMIGMGLTALAVIAIGSAVTVDHGVPQRGRAMADLYRGSLVAATDFGFPPHCEGTNIFGTALRPCTLGHASDHDDDVLVMGDSFAQMWYAHIAEFKEALAGHAVVFITKGGCPPVAGLDRTSPGFACSSFHRLAMEQAQSSRYHTIIFAGMWTSYFTRNKTNSVICGKDGARISAGTEGGLTAALDGIAQDLDDLHARGKNLVVLTTSPYPSFDVPAELRRRLFEGKAVPSDWTFDFAAIMAESQPIDAGLMRMQDHGATVVDLARLLCRDMICPLEHNGMLLYVDGSHLRGKYAALAGSFLDPFTTVRGESSEDRDLNVKQKSDPPCPNCSTEFSASRR